MDCSAYRQALSAMQDGEATAREIEELEPHVQVCADCRTHRDALVQVRERLAAWPDEAPQGRAKMPGRAATTIGLRRVAMAAAVVAALALGFFAGRASTPRPESVEAEPAPLFTESNVVIVPARNEVYSSAVLTLADSNTARGNLENRR